MEWGMSRIEVGIYRSYKGMDGTDVDEAAGICQ